MAATGALPAPSVIKAWNEGEGAPIQTVLTWAKVSGPLAAAFLAALDAAADEPYKSLMLMSEDEAVQVTDAIKIGEAKPGPLQLAKIRLVFAAEQLAESPPPDVVLPLGPRCLTHLHRPRSPPMTSTLWP